MMLFLLKWMYSLYSLGLRITPEGVDELPLAAIEVRKATKSTQTTKQDYQWRQQGLRIFSIKSSSKNLLRRIADLLSQIFSDRSSESDLLRWIFSGRSSPADLLRRTFSVGSFPPTLLFSSGLQSDHINSIVEHLGCRIAVGIE